MALPVPSPDDLNAYINGLSDTEAIQRATDLFTLATGLDTIDTTNLFEVRLVRAAILDMAWFLKEDHNNMEAQFSPFNSERIGSYSYSKASKAIDEGQSTGVKAFDQAVKYYEDQKPSIITMDSEWVFGGRGDGVTVTRPDPSFTYTLFPEIPGSVVRYQGDSDVVLDENGWPILEIEE